MCTTVVSAGHIFPRLVVVLLLRQLDGFHCLLVLLGCYDPMGRHTILMIHKPKKLLLPLLDVSDDEKRRGAKGEGISRVVYIHTQTKINFYPVA
jgi:hypothetical protein